MTHHPQETNLVDNCMIKILLTEDDDDSVVVMDYIAENCADDEGG